MPKIPVRIIVETPPFGAKIEVRPPRFVIHRQLQEEVEWSLHPPGAGTFTVDFMGNSPFQKSSFTSPAGGPISSGPIQVVNNPPTIYKYKVTVGNNVLDPDGEVDP